MDIKDISKIQQGVNAKKNRIEHLKIGAVVLFIFYRKELESINEVLLHSRKADSGNPDRDVAEE